MSNERETQKEIRRIVRVLEATSKLLERSALLDNFSDGETRCIRQFNNVLSRLNDLEALPEGLFDPLEDEATLADIAYAYHQVATYLKEGISVEDTLREALPFDFDINQAKKTIGEEMRNVGDVITRTFFKDAQEDNSESETIEVVEEAEETSDTVEPRLEKLEEQMGTIVQILQELRANQVQEDEEA